MAKRPDLTPYRNYPANYDAKFVAFHDANAWVFEAIIRDARKLKEAGFSGVGMRYLFERQRYTPEAKQHRDANPGILYGLNNDFATWYGRLAEATHKDLEGLFRLRKTAAEAAAVDASQGKFKFD